MTRSTVLAAVLLLALAPPAYSQGSYRSIVEAQLTAVQDGAHILWVTMYDCSVEPCSFGYKVYRR